MTHKPTILIANSRTGTNFFLETYKQLFPNDETFGEIFRRSGDSLPKIQRCLGKDVDTIRRFAQSDPVAFWDQLVSQYRLGNQRIIAKIFYQHVPRNSALWDSFATGTRVVHLVRRNAFDRFLSLKIALQTDNWVERGKPIEISEPRPIVVDVAELLEFIQSYKDQVSWARAKFGDNDYSELAYEEISDSALKCANRISQVFGVSPPDQIVVSIKKQKRLHNAQLVTNYDEVRIFDRELAF